MEAGHTELSIHSTKIGLVSSMVTEEERNSHERLLIAKVQRSNEHCLSYPIGEKKNIC